MDAWDERYRSQDTPWDQDEASGELVRLLDGRAIAPCRVLEIGCGTGANTLELARRGCTVTAFDLSSVAVERARERLAAAGFRAGKRAPGGGSVDLRAAGVHDAALRKLKPFTLVFDRGVYHVLQKEPVDLAALRALLEAATTPGTLWLSLAGNANEGPGDEGPPKVPASALVSTWEPLFELVELREIRFRARLFDGTPFAPLGWSALWRRRGVGPEARATEATA